MKRVAGIAKASLAVALALFAFAGARPAAAAEIKGSGSIAYVTRYIWRGQDLLWNNDPAIQPSFTFELMKSLSLNIWGSYGFGGPNEKNELDELDFTLTYSGEINKDISYSVGHSYYTFHVAGPDESQETFGGLSFPNVPLKPSLTLYGDWGSDVSRGYYLLLAGSHEIPLAWGLKDAAPALTLGLSAGYCDGQWSMEPGVSDLNVGLSLPITEGKFTITPSLTYTFIPHKASGAKGETSPPKINTQDEIWGGVAFGFGF